MTDIEARIEEEKRSKAVGWSDLHPDLLAEIFKRLDVVDYVQCLLVCTSWRSIPGKTMNICKPKRGRQLPWRLLVPYLGDKPDSRRVYGLSCFRTKMAKYTMHLPPAIAHRRLIGSSQGFLITANSSSTMLCAMNPLTGAQFPLPPTPTHHDILLYDVASPRRLIIPADCMKLYRRYHKAVISPSLDIIVIATNGKVTSDEPGGFLHFNNLEYARVGDDSWTTLVPPSTWTHLHPVLDFIFHKGRLYVLYNNGNLVVFNLENQTAPPLVSPSMDLKAYSSFLTETPDGDDILLLRRNSMHMVVFRLDKNTLEWSRVQRLGGVALFFDDAFLSSLSTLEFPRLRSNCV